MPKRSPSTPRSAIRSAVRQLWLRSRERSAAVKRDGNTCVCGKKGSQAKGREVKIEVHHLEGIDWDKVIEYIQRNVLHPPEKLICLCEECHEKAHNGEGI